MIISPYKVNDVIKRSDISTGNIFHYQNGNGTRYASLGRNNGFYYGFKLQMGSYFDDESAKHKPIKAVITPVTSQTVDKMCVIVGYFTLDLAFDNMPQIRTYDGKSIPPFGSIISTPNFVNRDGKPHLFMNLGPSVHNEQGIDLYPLSEDGNIKTLDFGSLLAIRGNVNFITHEQKEKKS
tara:strand:+ start:215 stop:754 length:540 start_codon:yes stop_codon:yes gene_type:complete